MLQVKADFPSYPQEGIYLDSATMGLQPSISITKQMEFIRDHPYTVRKALHKRARISEQSYYECKADFASFLNVSDDEIAYLPNVDIGTNMMLHSLLAKADEQPHVVSSVYEHHSFLVPLLHLKNQGKITLSLLETEQEPCVVEYLDAKIDEDDIVCFGHTTQVLGLYRNLEEIASVIHERGATGVFDLSRTIGQLPVDLSVEGIDIVFIDGSIDLLGPPMSGILYIDEKLIHQLTNPFPSSGNVGKVTAERADQIKGIEKFELGAPNIAGMIGLQSSINYLQQLGIEKITAHRRELISYLISRLSELDAVEIVDPLLDIHHDNLHRSSIVSIHGEFHAHDIALFLDETANIELRSGLLCAHPSVTSLAIEEVIQVSTHVYNDKSEVDTLIDGLQNIIHVLG